MASNETEVLDPEAAIEKLRKIASQVALSRRHFMALGVAGAAAAGTGLLSTPTAAAQEPSHNGYSQVDVLNFLLNVKYLTATLYSYITQGADLPASSGATIGTGQVYNPVAKITFSGTNAQQITDMFNEMYYDELGHVIDLRNLIESMTPGQPVGGTAVVARQSLNLLGNSAPGTAPSTTTTTMTPAQAIGFARLLEDLSGSACAGAAGYLSGTNRAYVSQMMAVDGFHAGAVRLTAIQNNSQLQASGYTFLGVTASAETLLTFSGNFTSGAASFYAMLVSAVVVPTVGNAVSGNNVPQGAVISALVGNPVFAGAIVQGSASVTGVASNAGLATGQFIVGTGIPVGTTITAIGTSAPYTLTLSNIATTTNAAASLSVLINTAITGNITSGSASVTTLSSTAGLAAGQLITGTGIPANATIASVNAAASTLTLSANATATTAKLAITVGTTQVTLNKNLLGSGINTVTVIQPDSMDVQPADPGTAALSAAGPAAISGSSPAVYQGFFNTAGAATSNGSTPAGFAFARTFSQVLQVLINYNASNSIDANQNFEGGFYPVGVNGVINVIQPS